MEYGKILEKAKQKPVKVASIIFVLLFWVLTPLIAQKYFDISAITVSFTITVTYFVAWKLHERREQIKDLF